MPENELDQPAEAGMTETLNTRLERERLSRREALKKIGITSAMATFALFSVDDLARIAGNALQRNSNDNRIAKQLASELRSAGLAFATGDSRCGGAYVSPGGGSTPCTDLQNGTVSGDAAVNACLACNDSRFCGCNGGTYPTGDAPPCSNCHGTGSGACASGDTAATMWTNLQAVWQKAGVTGTSCCDLLHYGSYHNYGHC
jgi:hypothetical protein